MLIGIEKNWPLYFLIPANKGRWSPYAQFNVRPMTHLKSFHWWELTSNRITKNGEERRHLLIGVAPLPAEGAQCKLSARERHLACTCGEGVTDVSRQVFHQRVLHNDPAFGKCKYACGLSAVKWFLFSSPIPLTNHKHVHLKHTSGSNLFLCYIVCLYTAEKHRRDVNNPEKTWRRRHPGRSWVQGHVWAFPVFNILHWEWKGDMIQMSWSSCHVNRKFSNLVMCISFFSEDPLDRYLKFLFYS